MPNTFKETLQKAFAASEAEVYHRYEEMPADIGGISLSDEAVGQLSEKILLLSPEDKTTLFHRYYFGLSPQDTELMWQLPHAKGRARFLRHRLAVSLGLGTDGIAETSLEQAVEKAVAAHTDTTGTASAKPRYSAQFKRRLKQIKAAQRPANTVVFVLQRVAIVILVLFLAFSTIVIADAGLRKIVVHWFVDNYSDHSKFSMQTSDDIGDYGTISYTALTINYIPDGFELDEQYEDIVDAMYIYMDNTGTQIVILLSDYGPVSLDRENEVIHEIKFGDDVAFYWERNGFTHFVWSYYGILCNIAAEIPLEEVIKIAENITLDRKSPPLADSSDFTVNYIPEGFDTILAKKESDYATYLYWSADNKQISIFLIEEGPHSLDTENAIIHEMNFGDNIAFYWEKGGITYFVWSTNGILCTISAHLPLDEVIKIAENITLDRKSTPLADFSDFTVNYIPEGFELYAHDDSGASVLFVYANSKAEPIYIMLNNHDGISIDHENEVIHEMKFGDNIAFYWEREGFTHFVWSKYGIPCAISAKISLEETIKIAENINLP